MSSIDSSTSFPLRTPEGESRCGMSSGFPFVMQGWWGNLRSQLNFAPRALWHSTRDAMPAKKASGKKPKISPFQVYMKRELAKIKEEHPDMEHRERYKVASLRWQQSPQNPKNRV